MSAWELSAQARRSFCQEGFCVLDPCLSAETLKAFECECAALANGVDLDETDCVVDLWAPQALHDCHPARYDPVVYQDMRAKIVDAAISGFEARHEGVALVKSDRQLVVRSIMGQLASLAAQAFSAVLEQPACSVELYAKSGYDRTEQTAHCAAVCEKIGSRCVPDTRLFNEHYVVKPPKSGIEFGWHTDQNEQLQMCLNKPPLPYVSLWLPLCDTGVEEDNGTLEILPRTAQPQPPLGADKLHPYFLSISPEGEDGNVVQESATTSKERHCAAGSKDGREEADPAPSTRVCVDVAGLSRGVGSKRVRVRAGGAVLFASDVWHRSGPNRSSSARQVFYAQYTAGELRSDGTLGPRYRTPAYNVCGEDVPRAKDPRGNGASKRYEGEWEGRKAQRLSGPLSFAVAVPAEFPAADEE